MKNKTVIRRPNQAGEFTTIHNSILNDTRLSAIEFRILLSILSDADTFNLSHQLIINRFKVDKKTVQKAFKTFENCGYIRRTELKRGHYYTISEYGNLTPKEIEVVCEPAEETIELTEIEPLPIKAVTEQLDIADYIELITSLLPSYATDDNLTNLMLYLTDAIENRRLTKAEQMNEDNIRKIISKVIPAPNVSESIKYIHDVCDTHAGGKQITIGNKKEITSKVVKYFSDNKHLEITEKAIKSRILLYKTSYTSAGHLDQKYQN